MPGDSRGRDLASVEFKLDGKEINMDAVQHFEWTAFLNAGYRIHAVFKDWAQDNFDKEVIQNLLKKGRNSKEGLDVEFRIWQDFNQKEGEKTELRKAKVTTIESAVVGDLSATVLEIVAIDPASWYLNKGKSEGRAFKGKISDVIKEVVEEYSEGVDVEIDDTKDNKNNWWHMFRLDPKTFICSLVEWGSAVTNDGTPLVIQSQDDKFICKEWSKLKPPDKITSKKPFVISVKSGKNTEYSTTCKLKVLSNNILSVAANRLYCGSISATTGMYIDKQNSSLKEEQRYVNDEYTSSKLIPNPLSQDQSYKKPDDDSEESTFITTIPEFNNGDLGLKYHDYAIGRAKDWWTKLIYMTLRVKVTVEPGDTDFDDVKALGCAPIKLAMSDLKDMPYYLDGKWILYGYKHMLASARYVTELYLSRLDYDATGQPI